MVKLVDTADLKSAAFNEAYRFDSGSGHQSFECVDKDFRLAASKSFLFCTR